MIARVQIEGLDQLQSAMAKLGKEARGRVDKVVMATGLRVRSDIVRQIQRGKKTGVIYEKANPTRTHRSSAPGEAPATDTGRLVSSIDFKREGVMSASVGSVLAYAAMLEFGTAHIDPRPAWVPAVERARPKYLADLRKAMREASR